jgi:hypothetical protein
MKAQELINRVRDAAVNHKTLYVYACFGAPLNNANKQRYTNNCDYNRQPSRSSKIWAASSDTFGFDCVNLIKGILWGWDADLNHIYGGAVYGSNGCPDTNANGMFWDYCYDQTSDFSNIIPGEFVWMEGHIGVYIGGGLAVECTPIWNDGVQITAVGNIGPKSGYATRTWTSHGKSKLIDYSDTPTPGPEPTPVTLKYKVGDHVIITGQLFATADGDEPGRAVDHVDTHITRLAPGKPYPYNSTDDLGWVAESSVSYAEEPVPTGFKIGDCVKIVGEGNGSSYGDSNVAVPGYEGTITDIYEGRPFPYEVSDDEGVLGYYPESSLQKQ